MRFPWGGNPIVLGENGYITNELGRMTGIPRFLYSPLISFQGQHGENLNTPDRISLSSKEITLI